MKLSNEELFVINSHKSHQKFATHYLIFVIGMLLISTTATTQNVRKLSPKLYERVLKPGTMVEVKTIKDGNVRESNNTAINDLKMDNNSKAVATYGEEISIIDEATFAKLNLNPDEMNKRENFRIIPELHIEKRGSVTETYSMIFSTDKPFQYDYQSNEFNTVLGFYLVPENSSANSIVEPIDLELTSSVVRSIMPDKLKITHLRLPSTEVNLITDNVIDSAEVRIITAANTEGYTTYLKVKPALEILTNRSTLQGFGVQKIPVEVRLIGSSSLESVNVKFSISKGNVEPSSVAVSYNSPSTVYISSEGTGIAELTAISSNMKSNTISLNYTFPWSFLLFSMIGGLIGGLIRHYFNTENNNLIIKPVIGGIFIGFMGAVAYFFLGINLIGIQLNALQNEIAVLGFSALIAYFGINIVTKVGN